MDSSQSILLARKVIIIDAQQISAISSGAATLCFTCRRFFATIDEVPVLKHAHS